MSFCSRSCEELLRWRRMVSRWGPHHLTNQSRMCLYHARTWYICSEGNVILRTWYRSDVQRVWYHEERIGQERSIHERYDNCCLILLLLHLPSTTYACVQWTGLTAIGVRVPRLPVPEGDNIDKSTFMASMWVMIICLHVEIYHGNMASPPLIRLSSQY